MNELTLERRFERTFPVKPAECHSHSLSKLAAEAAYKCTHAMREEGWYRGRGD